MKEFFKDKILKDFVSCKIYTYSNENYDIEKTRIEQKRDYRVQEERKIEFFVED